MIIVPTQILTRGVSRIEATGDPRVRALGPLAAGDTGAAARPPCISRAQHEELK